MSLSQMDVITAFVDRLAEDGITLADPNSIKLDGRWHRAKVEGDRSSTGNLTYKIYFDDRPAGVFEDHKRGVTGTFSVRQDREKMSDEELREAKAQWARVQRERDEEQERQYRKAAQRAREVFESGTVPDSHPYLDGKKLAPSPGVRVVGDLLIVPTYSDFGEIASFQEITANGDKKYMPGGRMAGCFHPINGAEKDIIVVCEGYATGLAINRATGRSVACALSSGQLKSVADKFAAKFPNRELVIAADTDRWQKCRKCRHEDPVWVADPICPHCDQEHGWDNVGVAAARDTGHPFIVPPLEDDEPGSDWLDWLAAGGDEQVLIDAVTGTSPTPDDDPDGEPAPAPSDTHVVERPERQPQVIDLPPTKPQYEAATRWADMGLVLNGNEMPVQNLDNAVRILQHHPDLRGRIWYDEFLQKMLTDWTQNGDTREWADADDIRLCLFMQRVVGIGKMATGTAREAATAVAMAHTRNEVVEWMTSLEWDGTDRLAILISRGFGAEDNDYTRAVGRCWMTSMAARALDPGCKVDTMPVFEGRQGKRKSTALQVLAGRQWFAESSESPTSKDFFQALTGKLLVEIGEMDSFSKAEVHTIKRVISCQSDRYRAPYGRRAADHPRMSVFAGTTNKDDWNRDETGARRFWPVTTGEVDIDWLKASREQLFAQAVALYRAGASWWDVPEEDAKREQDQRRQDDVWEPVVEEWLYGRREVTSGAVLEGALGIERKDWSRPNQMRVGQILATLGWSKRVVWRDGKSTRVWAEPVDGQKGSKGSKDLIL